jgi:RNA polymerase sigma factor (sigma-70 family)
MFEPGLAPALRALTARQRSAVVLVHGFGWSMREVAELTGTKVTTVQNHLERGLAKLRRTLVGGSP